jgi:hypothetical protein
VHENQEEYKRLRYTNRFFLNDHLSIVSLGLNERSKVPFVQWNETYTNKQKWDLILDHLVRLDPEAQADALVNDDGVYAPFLQSFIDALERKKQRRDFYTPLWPHYIARFTELWSVLSSLARERLTHTKSDDQARFMQVMMKYCLFDTNNPCPVEFFLSFFQYLPIEARQEWFLQRAFLSQIVRQFDSTCHGYTAETFILTWPRVPLSIKQALLDDQDEDYIITMFFSKLFKERGPSSIYRKYLSALLDQEPNRYLNGMLAQQGVVLSTVASFLEDSPAGVFFESLSDKQLNLFLHKTFSLRKSFIRRTNLLHWLIIHAKQNFLSVWNRMDKTLKERVLWIEFMSYEHSLTLLEQGILYLPDELFRQWFKTLKFSEARWQKELLPSPPLPDHLLEYEKYNFTNEERRRHIDEKAHWWPRSRTLSMVLCYRPNLLPVFLAKVSLIDIQHWVKENQPNLYAFEMYEDNKENRKQKQSDTATFISFRPKDSSIDHVLRVDFTQGIANNLTKIKIPWGYKQCSYCCDKTASIEWATHRNDVQTLKTLVQEEWFQSADYSKKNAVWIAIHQGHVRSLQLLMPHLLRDLGDKFPFIGYLNIAINRGFREGLPKAKLMIDYLLEINAKLSKPYVLDEFDIKSLQKLGYFKKPDTIFNREDQWQCDLGHKTSYYRHGQSREIYLGIEEKPDDEADKKLLSIDELKHLTWSNSTCLLDWDTFFEMDAEDEHQLKLTLKCGQKTLRRLKKMVDKGMDLVWLVNHSKTMARKYARFLHQNLDDTQQFNIQQDILDLFAGIVYLKPNQTKAMMLDEFAKSIQTDNNRCFIIDRDETIQQKAQEYSIMPIKTTVTKNEEDKPMTQAIDEVIKKPTVPLGEIPQWALVGWIICEGLLGADLSFLLIELKRFDVIHLREGFSVGVGVLLFAILAILTIYGVKNHNLAVKVADNREAFFSEGQGGEQRLNKTCCGVTREKDDYTVEPKTTMY